jgi:hypothetical protein
MLIQITGPNNLLFLYAVIIRVAILLSLKQRKLHLCRTNGLRLLFDAVFAASKEVCLKLRPDIGRWMYHSMTIQPHQLYGVYQRKYGLPLYYTGTLYRAERRIGWVN